ncbi:adenine deaminase [Evansella caseinilytica]|uniref:Adenine deaminase n=1 Tax=Evansella caseinilytica TaxID=1503961 RepID=A0A1H3RI24_9BACI|nr:adenine deaminase [Evansella caseinilytica]SDZ25233.1 adenine deaminase [Evansella caseinilytica]
MKAKIEQLKRNIFAAGKKEPADLIIKNARIVDVFNLEIIDGDIAVVDGVIVGIGEYKDAREVIDANHRYITPSFIDGHVHIESSMVTPKEFAKVVLPHGVTTVVTDPHEIANVLGTEGILFMLEDAKSTPLEVLFMLPSCVPATSFENAGAVLHAKELEPLFSQPAVSGLAEIMDYPAVMNAEEPMLEKIVTALNYSDNIDGHAAGLDATGINIYRTAGIRTDHECVSPEEAKERLQRGMYVMIREGSAAKNLTRLIPAVHPGNARRCFFCTDDKHLDELISEGSIDHNVRLAISLGLDPILAIQMASLNAAECFGLKTKGAIAPGFDADFLIMDDLEKIKVDKVFKAGVLVAENGEFTAPAKEGVTPDPTLTNTVQLPAVGKNSLQIPIPHGRQANIIGIIPNQIVTKKHIETVVTANGCFVPSVEKDQVKLAVIERHQRKGNIGLGIVKGLGLKSGAIASTVAHDSHNLVVAGTTDRDILAAITAIEAMNGGLVVVDNGHVIGSVSLPIAGLISMKNYLVVKEEILQLHESLKQITASDDFNLFLTLSFLSLPVIPELKLTDTGLFDVTAFQHIAVAADES